MARIFDAFSNCFNAIRHFVAMTRPLFRAAVIFPILATSALAGCSPQTPESVLAEIEKQEPFYATIREKDPALYGQIRQIIQTHISSGNGDAARTDIRKLVLPAIIKRVPDAPSATLLSFITLARDQGRYIAAKKPDLCPGFLSGRDMGLNRFATKDMMAREAAILDELLRSTAEPDAPRASDEEVGRVLVQVMPRLRSELGLTEAQIVAGLQRRGPGGVQCTVAAELFDEFLQLPPAQRDRVLRKMASMA